MGVRDPRCHRSRPTIPAQAAMRRQVPPARGGVDQQPPLPRPRWFRDGRSTNARSRQQPSTSAPSRRVASHPTCDEARSEPPPGPLRRPMPRLLGAPECSFVTGIRARAVTSPAVAARYRRSGRAIRRSPSVADNASSRVGHCAGSRVVERERTSGPSGTGHLVCGPRCASQSASERYRCAASPFPPAKLTPSSATRRPVEWLRQLVIPTAAAPVSTRRLRTVAARYWPCISYLTVFKPVAVRTSQLGRWAFRVRAATCTAQLFRSRQVRPVGGGLLLKAVVLLAAHRGSGARSRP